MNGKQVGWIAAAALVFSGVAAAHDGGGGWEPRARHDGWRAPVYAPPYGYQRPYAYPPPDRYGARVWRRGDRFPVGYGRAFGPSDYARHGLYAPPRGYQWVQAGNDFLLTALATGVILDVLIHAH